MMPVLIVRIRIFLVYTKADGHASLFQPRQKSTSLAKKVHRRTRPTLLNSWPLKAGMETVEVFCFTRSKSTQTFITDFYVCIASLFM